MQSMAQTRRVKYARANAEMIFQTMRYGAKLLGLPPQCSLAGAGWDDEQNCFILLVESPEFPELSDPASIEEIMIQLDGGE